MVLPDIDALSSYQGPLDNYAPIVDPTRDEDASSRNKYAANVAMMTWTAVRAMFSFVGANGANPTEPASGFIHGAVWGNRPIDKPVAVRAGEGIVDVTWPATVNSELTSATVAQGGGSTHSVNFRRAYAQVESADGTFKAAHAKVTGPFTVRVYCYTGTTLDDLPGLIVNVWVW